jgi:hypothetical protein
VGYYIRFLLEDDRPLSLEEILAGLRAADPGFALTGDGHLTRDGELLAELEVSLPGGGLFEGEIEEFREEAAEADGAEVAARLGSVTAIVAARVLHQDSGSAETLRLLAPLWDWLTTHRRGLVQADGEGFYDQGELILETG